MFATVYNAVKPQEDQDSSGSNNDVQISAINITPITIQPEGPTPTSLNSDTINASLNAALSNATSASSGTTSVVTNSVTTTNDVTNSELSPGLGHSPKTFTRCEPWQKAEVWKYFDLTEDEIHGRRTICKMCQKGLSYNVRTTSTMRNHIKKKHPEITIANIMKPRKPRNQSLSLTFGENDAINIKENADVVKIKEEPADHAADGAPSAASSSAAALASAKGATLSQALSSARTPPAGKTPLRMIRPAPAKHVINSSTSGVMAATTQPTVILREQSSEVSFTIPAPAGITQNAFPGLTPVLASTSTKPTKNTQVSTHTHTNTKLTKNAQVSRPPPPLRPAPSITTPARPTSGASSTPTSALGTLTLPLTVTTGGNIVRPVLIAPQRDSTPLTPKIAQTFSLRDMAATHSGGGGGGGRVRNTPGLMSNSPARAADSAARRPRPSPPVRVGPGSPIVISPTPSPDLPDSARQAGNNSNAHPLAGATSRLPQPGNLKRGTSKLSPGSAANQSPGTASGAPSVPQFTSWRHKQSAEKKRLVNKLRDTLFKFCEENLQYSKCLHLKGEVLVIYDDDSLAAEFDKHLHAGEIARDKKVRAENEAKRAETPMALTNQQPGSIQPIIARVTSLATGNGTPNATAATPVPGNQSSGRSGSKRAASLDQILGAWQNRTEDAGNDSDADSYGLEQQDPADADWIPPAKKSRGMKRKAAVPTRIIKQSQLLPPESLVREQEDVHGETDASGVVQNEHGIPSTESHHEDSSLNPDSSEVQPITIAPESEADAEDAEPQTNRREESSADAMETEKDAVNHDNPGNNLEIAEKEKDSPENEEDSVAENNADVADESEEGEEELVIDETNEEEKASAEHEKVDNEGTVSQEPQKESQESKLENTRPEVNLPESHLVAPESAGSTIDCSESANENKDPEVPDENEAAESSTEMVEDTDAAKEGAAEEANHETEPPESSADEFSDEDESERAEEVVPGRRTPRKRNNPARENSPRGVSDTNHSADKETRRDSNDNEKSVPSFSGDTDEHASESQQNNCEEAEEQQRTGKKSRNNFHNRPTLNRSRSRPEGKVHKGEGQTPAERDPRIAPVERPNTRRLSRRITRDDDDYVT